MGSFPMFYKYELVLEDAPRDSIAQNSKLV